ncbi:NAD(P)-binding protein [Escherichia coli]
MPTFLRQKKNLAVVGAGPAGLAFAINAAARGHQVHCSMPTARSAGNQYRQQIPGKEEFYQTLRYYHRMIESDGRDAETQSHRDGADQVTGVR